MNIKEYNKHMLELHEKRNKIKNVTNITCECGFELKYTDDGILCSIPPKQKVYCEKCGFIGYIIL